MSEQIIPLNDRVLVEPIETDSISAGGIVVAMSDEFKSNRAIVLAVGPGRNMSNGRIPIDVAVGDIIVYGDVQNTVHDKLNGKEVLLIVEMAIIAIVKG